jgi:hypothetical protein
VTVPLMVDYNDSVMPGTFAVVRIAERSDGSIAVIHHSHARSPSGCA